MRYTSLYINFILLKTLARSGNKQEIKLTQAQITP